MAKYYTTEHIHPYSWDQVAQAVFQRYPNPHAQHVLSEDTLHREIVNDCTLYSRRFLTKTNKVPSWAERWLKGLARRVPLVEESFVDNKSRTITIYTRSIAYANFMVGIEKVVYKASSDNPSHTVASKEGWVESNFYGLRSAIKNFGIERFKKNIVKSTEGFNHVLDRLQTQQNQLRSVAGVKLAEFHLKRDQLRSQAHETVESMKELGIGKVESIREASSVQWSQAKENARKRADVAKETALKGAERVIASTTLHASEQNQDE